MKLKNNFNIYKYLILYLYNEIGKWIKARKDVIS